MTDKEIEKMEKSSIFSLTISSDLKDQIVSTRINELNRVIKKELKRRDLVIIVMEKP
jgi:hypothetical protein